jgi:uncharacterized membrane protein YeaQ/YmgE (transglycosylase-associated protein family)
MSPIAPVLIGSGIGFIASFVMKIDTRTGRIASVLIGGVSCALGAWLAGVLGITPTVGVTGEVLLHLLRTLRLLGN